MSKKKAVEIKKAKVIRSAFDQLVDFYSVAISQPELSFHECLAKADLTPQQFKACYEEFKNGEVAAWEEIIDYSLAFNIRRANVEFINSAESVKDACIIGDKWLESRFSKKKIEIEQQKLDAVIAQSKAERDSADDPSKFEVVLNL